MDKKRASFSGKLGFILATAGSAVGLGNIWRFPYLAAKYGGGIFLLVYIILAITFGYTMMTSEMTIGRMTRKSPVGSFGAFGSSFFHKFGGWINAVIPMLIGGYYAVIGGWVFRYFVGYLTGKSQYLAEETTFTEFLGDPKLTIACFLVYLLLVCIVVFIGVESGVEATSKVMMPVLVIIAVVIAGFVMTRPGAFEGVKYIFVPDVSKFSVMTFVSAMGQMFYSLSIAMGILYTYGSYMKREIDMEKSVKQVSFFDTAIAILAACMIIPAVFAYSGADATANLKAGPSLMFITIPKVFANMPFGSVVGFFFFLLVLLAALTSSISLMVTSVSSLCDEIHKSHRVCTVLITLLYLVMGILSALGFNVLDFISLAGMSILDMFDFLTNSLMMPIAAFCTCILVTKYVGIDKIEEEVKVSSKFGRKGMFVIVVKYIAPIFCIIILISAILNQFGIVTM